ncbi:hypothetical protein [Paraburkholderia phenazinium]|jgi:hypothetical protein|uniref:Uncharacterized protein n=1 Tax=Paraburkholderia phenazinium TaxID=60549 RepID=A0A1N6F914_9BURK|nr:hypothetical protein [Paraburkholderia phenazinium]SIN91740.1 hypothetical protein SAMN05444165_0067 [Paraburkholderia phenazinium]
MKMTIPMSLALLTLSGAASAWQPVVYPVRSQSASQQSVDAATCYSTASRQSGVNITREAQSPMRPKLASGAVGIGGAGQVSQPPLPASGTTAASGSVPASAAMATAAPASASGTPAAAAQASEPMPKTDKNGVPELGGASEPLTEAEVKAPPMPPPEPPMTRYWRAYATCMQGRGYTVQ